MATYQNFNNGYSNIYRNSSFKFLNFCSPTFLSFSTRGLVQLKNNFFLIQGKKGQSYQQIIFYIPLSPPPKDHTVLPSLDKAIVCELPQETSPTLLMSFTNVGMLRLLLSP